MKHAFHRHSKKKARNSHEIKKNGTVGEKSNQAHFRTGGNRAVNVRIRKHSGRAPNSKTAASNVEQKTDGEGERGKEEV